MIRETSEPGSEAQPQVFISYGRADAEQVLNIARLLEAEGATVWRDGERILGGQYYGEEIVHAIAHSRVVMLMCSPHSLQSDNVHREVLLTWEYAHRRYVPVWLSPATAIPERFRWCLVGCQWIDAHSQPQEQWLPQLINAFKAFGVDTKNRSALPAEPTPGPSAETDRRVLRFRPGDRPIRGADWELERLLGKGGFGEVWKAHNPDLPGLPPVALKFCTLLDDRSKGLLRHEADMVLRAQRQIRSTGIVPLLHAYLNNDPPCLEYPYIEGGTLVRLIDECRQSAGSFRPARAQGVIQRVAQIVCTAHRATPKLVHRDLKPSNILVERREDGKIVLRVTDFGIGGVAAQPVLERSRSTSSLAENMASVLTGSYSPLYASPQQMRGDKPDPRDDVYALGVIWYQLLTGDLTSPAPTGRRWVDDLRKRRMTDAAVDLLSSCFESAPTHRPDDAGVLTELLQALPTSASTKPTTDPKALVKPDPPAPAQRSVVAPEPATELVNSIGMKLELIPAGEFQMGSTESDDEKPQHLVTISRPFYLGVYPVTQREYMQITRKNPSHFSSGDRLPVETVSWFDAVAFCNALSLKEGLKPFYAINGQSVEVPDWNGAGYRLPTEAEWEYACRAGTTTRFSFGDDENAFGQYAWYSANSSSQTHPVGEKKPNAFGLYDMHGNVWEWCWDGYDAGYYAQSPAEDPRGPDGAAYRVDRGGSWNGDPQNARSAYRLRGEPGYRNRYLGFRVARVQVVR